jgi:hypothetical protein
MPLCLSAHMHSDFPAGQSGFGGTQVAAPDPDIVAIGDRELDDASVAAAVDRAIASSLGEPSSSRHERQRTAP